MSNMISVRLPLTEHKLCYRQVRFLMAAHSFILFFNAQRIG